jgi:hypothetical protein
VSSASVPAGPPPRSRRPDPGPARRRPGRRQRSRGAGRTPWPARGEPGRACRYRAVKRSIAAPTASRSPVASRSSSRPRVTAIARRASALLGAEGEGEDQLHAARRPAVAGYRADFDLTRPRRAPRSAGTQPSTHRPGSAGPTSPPPPLHRTTAGRAHLAPPRSRDRHQLTS